MPPETAVLKVVPGTVPTYAAQPVNGVVQSTCGSEGPYPVRPEPGSSMSNSASDVFEDDWGEVVGNRRLVTVVL